MAPSVLFRERFTFEFVFSKSLTDFPRTCCLYLSFVVQFSMTLAVPFWRQLEYYTTIIFPCQHFF
jgi:hypothetical protein